MDRDNPCEICGGDGYADIIVACSQCKTTHEHPYCMRVMYKGDPEKWVCEECISAKQMPLPRPGPSKQLDNSKMGFRIKKPLKNSKVQYITPEEAMVLESGAIRNSTSSSKFPNRQSDPFKILPPRATVERNLPPRATAETNPPPRTTVERNLPLRATVERNLPLRTTAERNLPPRATVERNPPPRATVERNLQDGPLGSVKLLNNRSKPGCSRDKKLTFEGVDIDAQPKSIKSERRESFAMKLDKFLPNHPAESPTWKGNFRVIGGDIPCRFCDGIQAHPPSKVHRKVYEFSKQLPKALQFELIPRLNLWVDVFQEDVPSGLDIGLYFLPLNRHKKSYDCLVEYLGERDMLLRSCIDDVELLIFSSGHLQEDCQRINKKYFLWGVFRSAVDEKSEDMDIDMMGGQDVGKVDIIVQKPAEARHVNPKKGNVTPQAAMYGIKELPQRPTDSIPKFSLSKVKMESPGIIEEYLDDFDRELQRSFERFATIMRQSDSASAVKSEDQI